MSALKMKIKKILFYSEQEKALSQHLYTKNLNELVSHFLLTKRALELKESYLFKKKLAVCVTSCFARCKVTPFKIVQFKRIQPKIF